MSKFEGIVDNIVYRNEENGWTVASIRLNGSRNGLSAVGIMPFLSAGEHAIFDGELVEHRDYGQQIKVTTYETTRPQTKTAVEKYLGSGMIRGIGKKTAKLLVDYFGARALEVLESTPDRLSEVPGIGRKRAAMIAQSFSEQNDMRGTLMFLQGYGLTPALSMKVYKAFGDTTEQVLRSNPYRLVDEIQGIGFQTADDIAMRMGFGRESEFRIRTGIKYVLSESANGMGHMYLPMDKLAEQAARVLNAEPALVDRELRAL